MDYTRMNLARTVMGVEDDTIATLGILEEGMMPHPLKSSGPVKYRIALKFDPRSQRRISHGIADAIIRTFVAVGRVCHVVFAFVPQYEQLNAAQKAYYLYFREEANKGNYIEAGQSYVFLYIFEIPQFPPCVFLLLQYRSKPVKVL